MRTMVTFLIIVPIAVLIYAVLFGTMLRLSYKLLGWSWPVVRDGKLVWPDEEKVFEKRANKSHMTKCEICMYNWNWYHDRSECLNRWMKGNEDFNACFASADFLVAYDERSEKT